MAKVFRFSNHVSSSSEAHYDLGSQSDPKFRSYNESSSRQHDFNGVDELAELDSFNNREQQYQNYQAQLYTRSEKDVVNGSQSQVSIVRVLPGQVVEEEVQVVSIRSPVASDSDVTDPCPNLKFNSSNMAADSEFAETPKQAENDVSLPRSYTFCATVSKDIDTHMATYQTGFEQAQPRKELPVPEIDIQLTPIKVALKDEDIACELEVEAFLAKTEELLAECSM
jgi:hypothetical protein